MMKLSKEQRKTIAEEAKRQLCRISYKEYAKRANFYKITIFRHLELIAEVLQRIADGEQLFVLIEMPPRHGKSLFGTETYPSFYLGKNPDKRVIVSSYSGGLAKKFGRMNRNKFADNAGELFGLKVSKDNAAANNWGIEGHKGGMISVGIGGAITGEGADLLVLDDVVKNAKEANSPTYREMVWNEWESTLSTRLHDGGSVVVIMTRWHEDDLIGRLLERSPRDWVRLRLPAIAEDEDDLLGREIGEALCPELGFDEEWAEQKKLEVGSRTWSSLYQQRPAPAAGAIFNRSWIKFYKVLPTLDERLTSWDMTFKGGEGSDRVAGQIWGRKGAEFYLTDSKTDKMDFTSSLQAVKTFHAKHRTPAILIEDKANGPAIINSLQREVPGIIPIQPIGDKVTRASAVAPYWEAGNVYLPDPSIAPWVDDFIEELVSFPYAKNDDIVDAMSQALNRFTMVQTPNIREL